jgi:transposase-like protein
METNPVSSEKGRSSRRQHTPEQISEYLEAQPRSGLTVTNFCRQSGLNPSVFYAWKRRRRLSHQAHPTFRELSLPSFLSAPWAAEIALPSGALLRVSSQAEVRWVGQLLDQLARA